MIDNINKFNYWQKTLPQTGFFRRKLIDQLLSYQNSALVKVITGQRRCGKSYLLRMMIKHLITEAGIDRKNILYLNMEMPELLSVTDYRQLLEIISEYRKELSPKGKYYLFLDEIQEVSEWEKLINSISQNSEDPCEVFITGSNAHLLSSELATYLTGRYVPIEVLPFSYQEYREATRQPEGMESLAVYLQQGGMPELLNFPNDETKRNYLGTLRDSILLNDIVRRHKLRDVALLQRLYQFTADTIGSLFSVNGIVRHLNGIGYKTNVETVANHLHHLCDAYLIHETDRFDIQGKRILSGERKYYLNDTSFRYFLSSSFDPGPGKYLENAMYLHLRRNGYTVYTGRTGSTEVDFIAEKGNERIYCQVAYMLTDEKVVEREFRSLLAIKDNFPKFVVTMDPVNIGNREGIQHLQAWKFFS